MTVKISGVLKDGTGKPVQNCTIVLKARRTSSTVVVNTHMTLEFSVSAWLVNNWYPTASISDLLVVVMKKATAGITIS